MIRARRQPTEIVAPHVLRVPDPEAVVHQGGLDAAYGLGMAGALSAPRIGTPSGTTGVGRFGGDCGPLQNFGKGRFAGASTTHTRSLNASQTPGNPSVTTQTNPVLQAMVNNGLGI